MIARKDIFEMFDIYPEIYLSAVYDLIETDLGLKNPYGYPLSQLVSIVHSTFTPEEVLNRFQSFTY